MRISVLASLLAIALAACSSPPIVPTQTATIQPAPTDTPTLPVVASATAQPQTTEPPLIAPTVIVPSPTIARRPTTTPASTPITITYFSAASDEIDPGDSITLSWQASGGQVTLTRLNALGQMMLPIDVPLSGTLTITTDVTVRNQISFQLFATNPSDNTHAQAGLSVRVRCPDIWFFPNGPDSCPQSSPIAGAAAVEHFEHGFMIWFEPRKAIYILYADEQFSPKWDLRQDNFVEGQPESDPSLIPSAGLYQPVRGFGLVWRDEQAAPGYRVRDRLGWAIDREQAFQSRLQCDSAPKYVTCYLQDERDKVIVLKPERSAWAYWGE